MHHGLLRRQLPPGVGQGGDERQLGPAGGARLGGGGPVGVDREDRARGEESRVAAAYPQQHGDVQSGTCAAEADNEGTEHRLDQPSVGGVPVPVDRHRQD